MPGGPKAAVEPARPGLGDRAGPALAARHDALGLHRDFHRRVRRMFYSILRTEVEGRGRGQIPREHDGRDHLDRRPVHHPDRHGVAGDQDGRSRMKDTSQRRPHDQGHRLPVEMGLRLPAAARARASRSCRSLRRRAEQIDEPRRRSARPTCSRSTTRWSCRSTRRSASCLTANDVIHAWWVPALRRQAGRDPRIRARHLVPRRQAPAPTAASARNCAARTTRSCRSWSRSSPRRITRPVGRRSASRKWLRKADDPDKELDAEDLMARGEKVYPANCVGLPPGRPARACRARSRRSTAPEGRRAARRPDRDPAARCREGRQANGDAVVQAAVGCRIAAVITYTKQFLGQQGAGTHVQPAEVREARKGG